MIVKEKRLIAFPGLTYVSDPDFIGADFLVVKKEGLQFDETSSAPEEREYKPDIAMGRIEFRDKFTGEGGGGIGIGGPFIYVDFETVYVMYSK